MAKVQTLKVSFAISCHVKRDGFFCRDEGQSEKPLGSRMMVVNALREVQSPPLRFGDATQSASGDASQVAPALWVPSGVDILPKPFDTASPVRINSASGMPFVPGKDLR